MFESDEQAEQESGTPAEGGGEGAPSEGGEGSPSGAPSPTSPPDNPPVDDESVQKGEENLDKVVGN